MLRDLLNVSVRVVVTALMLCGTAVCDGQEFVGPTAPRLVKIHLVYVPAAQAVRELKALPKFGDVAGLWFHAYATDNTILATYGSDDQLRELKEAIRLLDVSPQHVEVRAEVVLSDGEVGHKHRGILEVLGRTENAKPVWLKTRLGSTGASWSTLSPLAGRYAVRVVPQVNGDYSISLDADGTVDVTVAARGVAKPLHVNESFNGSMRLHSGDTMLLTRLTDKLGNKGVPIEGEADVLVYLTARILPEAPGSGYLSNGMSVLSVIVPVFANAFGKTGDALSMAATSAVIAELTNSRYYQVIQREEIERVATEMHAEAPYDAVTLRKIASSLGADAVVTGRIARLSRSANSASASLRVVVEDTATGTVLQTAHQTVKLPPDVQREHEAGVKQALADAAFLLVRRIEDRRPPEGIVLSPPQGATTGRTAAVSVLLNIGFSDGIQAGTQLVVLRDGRRVGKVQVTRVSQFDSEARVVDDALGIRAEDTVRAVLPDTAGASTAVFIAPAARP